MSSRPANRHEAHTHTHTHTHTPTSVTTGAPGPQTSGVTSQTPPGPTGSNQRNQPTTTQRRSNLMNPRTEPRWTHPGPLLTPPRLRRNPATNHRHTPQSQPLGQWLYPKPLEDLPRRTPLTSPSGPLAAAPLNWSADVWPLNIGRTNSSHRRASPVRLGQCHHHPPQALVSWAPSPPATTPPVNLLGNVGNWADSPPPPTNEPPPKQAPLLRHRRPHLHGPCSPPTHQE
jgi:hypothetical protein